jgi:hypothetical protein
VYRTRSSSGGRSNVRRRLSQRSLKSSRQHRQSSRRRYAWRNFDRAGKAQILRLVGATDLEVGSSTYQQVGARTGERLP